MEKINSIFDDRIKLPKGYRYAQTGNNNESNSNDFSSYELFVIAGIVITFIIGFIIYTFK